MRTLINCVTLIALLAFCTSTQAALFQESFNTETANNAETLAAYPDFTLSGGGSPSAIVNGGQLFIQNTGNNLQRFTRDGMAGDNRLSADISASNSGGSYNVGLALGDNNIVFHPGFAGGGALRVEGPSGFGNTNMGFVPANGTLHNLAIDTFADTGLHRIEFTDGDTNQKFVTSYLNPSSVGGVVGFKRDGNPNGDSRYDNLSLAEPVLALNNIFSESFDTDAADTGAFNIAYPQITTSFPAGGSVLATGGNAVVSGDGGNDQQLLSIGTFTGEYVVQAEVGGTSNPGGWNTGLRIGENNITFHPGFAAGGAFRVEGAGGFGNQNVGFVPDLNDLHLLTVHAIGDGNFVVYLQNADDPNQVFRATYFNAASIDGLVSLRRSGPTGGDALFGSVNVFQVSAPIVPEPATATLLGLGSLFMTRRKRRNA